MLFLPYFFIIIFSFIISNGSAATLTEHYINQQESAMAIPSGLLKAIACTESGRKVGAVFTPWPWTINVNGQGHVYQTKEAAINAVKDFQKKGNKSIDVGPMQINLKHHPYAFNSLEDAFDIQLNIAYGAKYLLNLLHKYGSWQEAIGHYHSATPTHKIGYRNKVLNRWIKSSPHKKQKWQNILAQTPHIYQGYKPNSEKIKKNKTMYQNDLYALQLAHHQAFASKRAMKMKAITLSSPISNRDRGKFIPLARPASFHSVKGTHRRFIPLN